MEPLAASEPVAAGAKSKVVIFADIHIEGFMPAKLTATVEQLAGALDAVNTAQAPEHLKPALGQWPHHFADDLARYTLPPRSFTVIRFE